MKSYEKNDRGVTCYLVLLFSLAFLLPIIYFHHPFGDGDIYAHLYMTDLMSMSSSVDVFYGKLFSMYANPLSGYPYGMWLFGSITSQITDLSTRTIGCCLPLTWLFLTILSVFIFSRLFLKNSNKSILAAIFFITAPTISIESLGFYNRIFVLPFFFLLLYLIFNDKQTIFSKIPLFFAFSSIIILSHTGTAIFFVYVLLIYLLLKAIFTPGEKRFPNYVLLLTFFLSWILVMKISPQIYLNYWAKLRVFNSVIGSLPLDLSWLSNQYMLLIEYKNLNYLIFLGLAYIFLLEIVHSIRKHLVNSYFKESEIFIHIKNFISDKIVKFLPLLIVAIFITLAYPTMSQITFSRSLYTNSIFAPVFWWGPIQCFLFLFGFRYLDRRYVLLTLTFTIIILPFIPFSGPGTSVGVGITRFIFNYLIVMSLIVVEGLYNLSSIIPYKKMFYLFLVLIFSALFFSVLIGNFYFAPPIAETPQEVKGLSILKTAPDDVFCLAPHLRQRVELYGNIRNFDWELTYGKKRSFYGNYPMDVYLTTNPEHTKWLSNFGVEYIIDSKRVRKYSGTKDTRINERKELKKVYASKDFSIYQIDVD